ncbi:MAG: C40 family peptidase [Acidimicrobiales bacterium]
MAVPATIAMQAVFAASAQAATVHAVAQPATISNERAKALQVQAQLQAEGQQMNALAEQYDLARIEQSKAASSLATTESRVRAAERRLSADMAAVRTEAVSAYVQGGSVPGVPLVTALLQSKAADLSLQQGFMSAVAAHQQVAIQSLYRAERHLHAQHATLLGQQQRAGSALRALSGARAAAAAQAATLRQSLQHINGRVKALIAAEQQAAAQAAASALQARIAAQQAAAQQAAAQQAAATQAASAQQAAAQQAAAPAAPVSTTPSAPVSSTSGAGSGGGAGAGSGTTRGAPVTSQAWAQAAATAVSVAEAQVGQPYVWGAAGPNGFDCSGLIMYAWGQAGVMFPHFAAYQYADTTPITASQLQPGDLVFYYQPIDHVGIYVGNGMMIDAPYTGVDVRYDPVVAGGFAPSAYGQPNLP